MNMNNILKVKFIKLLLAAFVFLPSCSEQSSTVVMPYSPAKKSGLDSQKSASSNETENNVDGNSGDANSESADVIESSAAAEIASETLSYLASLPSEAAAKLKSNDYFSNPAAINCRILIPKTAARSKFTNQSFLANWKQASSEHIFEYNKPASADECTCLAEKLTKSSGIFLKPIFH
jgi:hypothetical protein